MELPAGFVSEIGRLLAPDEFERFAAAMDQPCPVSIRVNRRKMSTRVWDDIKANFHLSDEDRVAWCTDGYYLAERPLFTLDPLLHAGAYYVQEASSMFVAHLINIYIGTRPVRALDLCAAPGGKSTLLEACLPEGSSLTCNEVVAKRARILKENMTKWGGANVVVTSREARAFAQMGAEYDFILCDVPCSGEGMMRKDADARTQWSSELVDMCSRRQRQIVADIWPCLAPGGIMIYSTCTYNTRENEENVAWIARELGADILPVDAKAEWNIIGNLMPDADFPCAHFMPHRVRGEGFFCAVVRKYGDDMVVKPKNTGKEKRDESHPTPVSPLVDVDRSTALHYLHGDAICLPADALRGIVSVAYCGLPLGQAKNIGTRANNLYPKEWRIRLDV